MASIFISYDRDDSRQITPILDALTSKGCSIWLDQAGITGGLPWVEQIAKAIDESSAVLFFVSKESCRSRFVFS